MELLNRGGLAIKIFIQLYVYERVAYCCNKGILSCFVTVDSYCPENMVQLGIEHGVLTTDDFPFLMIL